MLLEGVYPPISAESCVKSIMRSSKVAGTDLDVMVDDFDATGTEPGNMDAMYTDVDVEAGNTILDVVAAFLFYHG